MIITVTPNPSIDRTLDVAGLVVGEVNRGTRLLVEPSGKGVNVSRALTVNGLASLAVLPAGGHEGTQLLALLRAEGVRHLPVPIDQPTRVNISVLSAGVATKLNEPGPEVSGSVASALLDAVGTVLAEERRVGWVVGAGSLPAGLPDAFYARLGALARAAGARFALDSSGAALQQGLAGRPALVKPNLTELAQLTGRELPTLGDVIDAARDIRLRTGGAVLVSLGRHGTVLVDGDGSLHGHATVTSVRSSVGAGDNLLAGFLAGLVREGDRAPAVREAVAWASVAVHARGSLGRRVCPSDRTRVELHADPDRSRPLS